MFEYVSVKRVPKILVPMMVDDGNGNKVLKSVVLYEGTDDYREVKEKIDREDYRQEREEWSQSVFKRVYSSYSPGKAAVIIKFEGLWDDCYSNEDFTDCYHKLKWLVDRTVRSLVYRWSKSWRLSYHDFESEIWEEVWKVITSYDPYENDKDANSDFFLYEKIELAIKRRGLAVVRRSTRTKKGKFWYGMGSLPDYFEQTYPSPENIDSDVTNKILVNQILSDPVLTKEEGVFLKVYYHNPGASFQQLADALGYKHRENARRVFGRIKKKLVSRYPDALG